MRRRGGGQKSKNFVDIISGSSLIGNVTPAPDLDGSVVAADIVDAQEDALAVLLLVRGSEVALKDNGERLTIYATTITTIACSFTEPTDCRHASHYYG